MEIPSEDAEKDMRSLYQTLDIAQRRVLIEVELGSISKLIFSKDAIGEDEIKENVEEIIENVDFNI